jgi:hypothetical protein
LTATADNGALSAFASAMPWATALFANSDPSVATNMRLYIVVILHVVVKPF